MIRGAGAQPSVWALRALIVLGVMVALLAGSWTGYTPPVALVVLVALGALLSPFRPEHLSLSITMALVIFWWGLQLRGEMPGTVLAYGPPSLPVHPELALLWATRGVLAWMAALVVWVVARAYTGHGTPSFFWLTGLTAAVIAAVVAGAAVSPRSPGSRP
jgi:hypothetical protein